MPNSDPDQHRTDGEVALVGAGPGDPGLLTLRALRVLQNADVVVHDRLISDEVLQLARRDAEFINVGKAAGNAPVPQEQINALLVEHAKQGKRVVRVKGGDPFIFGRGGEELEALAANHIRFEVVPGITAAIGCAAYSGIPLTHRDYAQSLTFVTGHLQDGRLNEDKSYDLDWDALARPKQTIVFYMGLNRLTHIVTSLCDHGAPADRAVALIEQGTSATQRVIRATLSTIVERALSEKIRSPALLIVGDVTRLHDALHWFNSTATRDSLASSVLQA
jgi:uroporphyrin-III C-methyltransferase / precorrin-2 dehydrogenase / sirohydrochlorin ferrochelatase